MGSAIKTPGRSLGAARSKGRVEREARTLEAMVRMYCRSSHGGEKDLCEDCGALLAYAFKRLEKCPYAEEKPVCSFCPTHCYKPDMREKVRAVMGHSGPRMLLRHPVLAILHLLDARKGRGRRRRSR